MEDKARETLVSLQNMFPTCDINTIKSVLSSNHGHLENTVEDLLKIAPQGESEKEPQQQIRVYKDEITEEDLQGLEVYNEKDFDRVNEIQAKEFQSNTDSELAARLYKVELRRDKQMYEQAQSWFGFLPRRAIEDDEGTQKTEKPGLMKKMTNGLKNTFKKKTPNSATTTGATNSAGLGSQSSPTVKSAEPKYRVPTVQEDEEEAKGYDNDENTPMMKLQENEKSFEIFPSVGPSRTVIKDPQTPVVVLEKPEKSFELFPSAPSRTVIHDEPKPEFDIFPSAPSRSVIKEDSQVPLVFYEKPEKTYEATNDPTPLHLSQIRTPINGTQPAEKSLQLFPDPTPQHRSQIRTPMNGTQAAEKSQLFPDHDPTPQHLSQILKTPMNGTQAPEKSLQLFPDPTPQHRSQIRTPLNGTQAAEKSQLFPDRDQTPLHLSQIKTPINGMQPSEQSFQLFPERDPTPQHLSQILKTPANALQNDRSFPAFRSETPTHAVETRKAKYEVYEPLVDNEEQEREESKHYEAGNYSMVSEGQRLKEEEDQSGEDRSILRLRDVIKKAQLDSGNNLTSEEDRNKASLSSQRMGLQIRI